jgi:bifunctional DNA-binding transcriptional regulator/antitoxin component of YhaV-PrlF toxin-antitoxin module
MKLQVAGEAKISPRGAVSLPARLLRDIGWKHGDSLFIEVLDEDFVLLSRKPASLAKALAGRLTHLFPGGDDTRRFLDEERAGWEEFDRRFDTP